MFNKNSNDNNDKPEKEETISAEASEEVTEASTKAAPTRTVSYIGPGLNFQGEVDVDEGLVIEGKVEGSITGTDKNIVVGKKGEVKGDIRGSVIEVRGAVDGEIYGSVRVHLYASAVIDGKIYCQKLVMDEGAVLNGTVDMNWKEQAKKPAKLKSVDGKSPEAEKAPESKAAG